MLEPGGEVFTSEEQRPREARARAAGATSLTSRGHAVTHTQDSDAVRNNLSRSHSRTGPGDGGEEGGQETAFLRDRGLRDRGHRTPPS